MIEQGSQGDPDVAVDVLLAGGAGVGIVMDSRMLTLERTLLALP